jgi:crotonobetainyl-CoA:carnitine CoA-transferase CaiB-like acyl-CoA transferase
MRDVLAGIRVVEVADWGFVPSAATVLGDWGAEVVKIEHPRFGDPIRGLVTSGLIPGASGRNFFVEHLGRNKRSIGIDLGHPEGRGLLDRLIARADVFLTSFLDDARERLRITWNDLRAVNPRLIYARGSGQGCRGPDARRGGYDGVSFWARGGVADRLSTTGQPPLQQRPAFGDFIGGMAIAGGIAAALFQRERTGEGLEVDVSLLGTALWVLSPDITAALMYGFMLPAAGDMPSAPNPLVGTYFCADGKGLVLMMLQAERFWPLFAETVGRPDLLERYPTAEARRDQAAAIRDDLAACGVGGAPARQRVHLGSVPDAARSAQ